MLVQLLRLRFQQVATITITAGTSSKIITITQASNTLVSATNKARKVSKLTSYTQRPNFAAFVCNMPYVADALLGFTRPKWMFIAQYGHYLFDSNNMPHQFGFAGSPDFTTWMVRGKDFIYPTNPDTASDPWAGNTDPLTKIYFPPDGKTVDQFIGINPKYRVTNFLNTSDDYGTLSNCYDVGKSQTVLSHFGKGDYISGKAQALFVAMDNEGSTDDAGWAKKIALTMGCASNMIGFAAEFYTPVFIT